MKNKKIILDLCGGTGSWSKPYVDAGYDVRLVTLPDFDVRTYKPPKNVYGILAAPPCTEFSIAKNHNIKRDLKLGMDIVNACLRIIRESKPTFFAIENPAGLLGKFLGHAQFSFQPWEFGDGWSKRTLIWGEFNKPVKKFKKWEDVPKIKGLYYRPGRKTASLAFQHLSHKKLIKVFDPFDVDSDASMRAITSPAFAKAFYKVNQ